MHIQSTHLCPLFPGLSLPLEVREAAQEHYQNAPTDISRLELEERLEAYFDRTLPRKR